MSLRESLYGIYAQAERVLVPGLKYSQSIYEQVLREYVTPETVWLDLGCGHQVLPSWRAAEEQRLVAQSKFIVGMDYDQHSLLNHRTIPRRVRGDLTLLPFQSNYFNLVTANMVVEHLGNPGVQFREVRRVLKPGGLFIFHTPNALGYGTALARLVPEAIKGKLIYLLDGRREEDVFETHYKANTLQQIEGLAQASDFEIVKIKMLVTNAMFAMVLPVALPELLWIRLLMTRPLRRIRTNIITIWQKPTPPALVESETHVTAT